MSGYNPYTFISDYGLGGEYKFSRPTYNRNAKRKAGSADISTRPTNRQRTATATPGPTVKQQIGMFRSKSYYKKKKGRVSTKTMTKRKRSKKSYKRRNNLKRDIWRLKKRMRVVPAPCKDVVLDTVATRWESTQGLAGWNASSQQNTLNPDIEYPTGSGQKYQPNTGFAISPESMQWLIPSILSTNPTEAFNPGRSKFILNSWELTTRITNLANCPAELECFTIKCKRNVPVENDGDTGLAVDSTFFNFLNRSYYQQFEVNSVTDPYKGCSHPSFKLSDINRFNQFFKVVSHKTRTVQPGEVLRLRKFRNKPVQIDTSKHFNRQAREYLNHYRKNALFYVYRIIGTPATETKVTNPTLCAIPMDVVHSLHARTSVLPYDQYDAVVNPGRLPSTQTITQVYVGTSEAKLAAPAT
nr:MAG: putative capsid protein [Arizlama virus]